MIKNHRLSFRDRGTQEDSEHGFGAKLKGISVRAGRAGDAVLIATRTCFVGSNREKAPHERPTSCLCSQASDSRGAYRLGGRTTWLNSLLPGNLFIIRRV